MNSTQLRRYGVIVALVATVAVNALANILPINKTTGEIANQFPIFFMPANYVFSIWSLIYVLLLAFSLYQFTQWRTVSAETPRVRSVRTWFILSCLANVSWILLWHYEYITFSTIAMGGLLVSLLVIYSRLRMDSRKPQDSWIALYAPFSVYFGWITVASIANVATALYSVEWAGWGIAPEMWTAIMLVVGTGIALSVILPWKDIAYGLVIIWAFIGIVVRFPDVELIRNTAVAMVIVVILALVYVGTTLYVTRKNSRRYASARK